MQRVPDGQAGFIIPIPHKYRGNKQILFLFLRRLRKKFNYVPLFYF